MRYRPLGRTGIDVSERSFGAWAIGGAAYGEVDRRDALAALACAEELGVNLIDTAAVYGDSEAIIGEFLDGRRDRWVVASKYSGQSQGMTALVEEQLRTLGTTWIDLYQIHWAPRRENGHLYEELYALRDAGKVRHIGVSLYSEADIDFVLSETDIDAIQVAFGLMDPLPLLRRMERIIDHGLGLMVRSSLKGGFLTGKYDASATFDDPADQRSEWSRERIAELAVAADRFRLLEDEADTLLNGAVSYPLNFPGVSTILLSAKNERQARQNFGIDLTRFSSATLEQLVELQRDLGLFRRPWKERVGSILSRLTSATIGRF